jgi:hypothetical protein
VTVLPVVLATCGLLACGATQTGAPRPTQGAIAGLVRDRASGEPIAMAEIQIAGRTTRSNLQGLYTLDHLPPGTYELGASFAGQPVRITNVPIDAGLATYVDITFTLGKVEPIVVDFGDPSFGAIHRYRWLDRPADIGRIEGTVVDTTSRARVAGAVVTAVGGPRDETLQTVTDDHGRYLFDPVYPGIYAVSAYYALGGRGQIEVWRNAISVDGAEGVIVPLQIEVTAN